MCISEGNTTHWSTYPWLLHPWGGRSDWFCVLKTHHHPIFPSLGKLQGFSRVHPATLLYWLVDTTLCKRPHRELTHNLIMPKHIHGPSAQYCLIRQWITSVFCIIMGCLWWKKVKLSNNFMLLNLLNWENWSISVCLAKMYLKSADG